LLFVGPPSPSSLASLSADTTAYLVHIAHGSVPFASRQKNVGQLSVVRKTTQVGDERYSARRAQAI